MMPDGWKMKTLGEIAKVTSGGTPSRQNPSYWCGNIPWVRTTEVQNCKIYEQDVQEFITEEGMKGSSAKMVPAGTILLAMIGQGKTRGQVALLTFPATTNQNCAAIILNNSHAPEYYFNYLLSQYRNIRALSNSAGQSNLSGSLVREIVVPEPPYEEQKKVAKILSTWDEAIATLEKIIANSQQQKKALMQQLLTGKKRLPGFGGKWNYKKISQVAKRIQGKSDGGDYPILTISSLSGFVRQDEKYNRYMAGKSVENYILLKRGEFAYNKGNSKTYEFGCVFDLETYEKGMVPHVYVCFKLNDGLSHRYFKYLFEADYLKPQLGRLVNTGVRNNGLLNIKPAEFLNTKVPVPSYEEQEKIADILHASSLQQQKLESELESLKREKSALMQQLLTGKRRVLI